MEKKALCLNLVIYKDWPVDTSYMNNHLRLSEFYKIFTAQWQNAWIWVLQQVIYTKYLLPDLWAANYRYLFNLFFLTIPKHIIKMLKERRTPEFCVAGCGSMILKEKFVLKFCLLDPLSQFSLHWLFYATLHHLNRNQCLLNLLQEAIRFIHFDFNLKMLLFRQMVYKAAVKLFSLKVALVWVPQIYLL
jgi:hypothetical protein